METSAKDLLPRQLLVSTAAIMPLSGLSRAEIVLTQEMQLYFF
jgi:hypothetical protein